ncbi:tRNA (guanine(10)-N2)-methyltransferase homolog [Branchiostoma lanceolatum]|uniref:tRNA (guanine(10)-N2)-methyltransferase homolog n=1 Tax=Branchiostoma lanceolatum TaxID=7740 RepID=UPI003454EE59
MAAPVCSTGWRRYLLWLAHEHLEFRIPEIQSIAQAVGSQLEICDTGYDLKSHPFVELRLSSEEDARKIIGRSFLSRCLLELWGTGQTKEELHETLRDYPTDLSAPYMQKDTSFRYHVAAFGKTLTMKRKKDIIDALDFLPFQGRVDLKNAEHTFYILEDYGDDPTRTPEEPYRTFFGRWIGDGQRKLIDKYAVRKRHHIGETSMDAGLSFVMANMAATKRNSVVFDPFVGTGSLLVSSAHFGSYVMGTDIDSHIVHGWGRSTRHNKKWRGEDENIRANLRQYGLEHRYLDVLISDAARSVWRPCQLFDAIVTDPPYGIREASQRLGTKDNNFVREDDFEIHSPTKTAYTLSDLLTDLLNYAAQHLTVRGRLVYWLPVYRPDYTEHILPRHPCLRLVSNCEQVLSTDISRRLISMEKIRDYQVHFHFFTPETPFLTLAPLQKLLT